MTVDSNTEALVRAAFEGDLQLIRTLLDAGTDVDGWGRVWNPLHAAVEGDHLSCVQVLVQRGADLEATLERNPGFTPLAHAVDLAIDGTRQVGGKPGEEPMETIRYLLGRGADPSPALEVALGYEHEPLSRLFEEALKEKRYSV